MRGVLAAAVALAGTATATWNSTSSNQTTPSNFTCAESLYILCARGSGEPIKASHGQYPLGTGSPGYLALEVAKQIPGTIIGGLSYPAVDPVTSPLTQTIIHPSDVDFPKYYASENEGADAIFIEVTEYVRLCPASKIALIGFSQGAHVIQDALCGGIGGPSNSHPPLPSDLVQQHIVAVALFGDPTHIGNLSIDRGTGVNNGFFARPNISVCEKYDSFTASWCDDNDPFCDGGDNLTVHEYYIPNYNDQIVQFVVDGYNNATKANSGSPSPSSTGPSGSSPTKNSASNLIVGPTLMGGAVLSFALWSL